MFWKAGLNSLFIKQRPKFFILVGHCTLIYIYGQAPVLTLKNNYISGFSLDPSLYFFRNHNLYKLDLTYLLSLWELNNYSVLKTQFPAWLTG